MKKIMLFVLCLWSAVAFAQKYDTIRLTDADGAKINITQELAKRMLLYSYVEITDSILLGETNFATLCHDDECIYSFLNHFHPKFKKFKGNNFYNDSLFPDKYQGNSITPGYRFITDFTNGYAIVSDMDMFAGVEDYGEYFAMLYGNHALCNKHGKICIPFKKFDKITEGVYDGYVTVCKDGKWGFANVDGSIMIKLQFEDARHFSEGLAAVKKDGLWGYIDKSGNVKIPFQYTWAGDFKRGVAVVEYRGIGYHWYDKSPWPSYSGFVLGLVDHSGHSSFDVIYENDLIKEYDGVFRDEKKDIMGNVKYSYYENGNGDRVYHGYYVFSNDGYRIEGHYNDGKKYGKWIEEWFNGNAYVPFFHDYILTKNDRLIIETNYDILGLSIGGKAFYNYDSKIECSFIRTFDNGNIIQDKMIYNGRDILIDENGCVYGEQFFSNYSDGEIPCEITMTFYKGVLMKVEKYDKSTGRRNILHEFNDFTSVEDIQEFVSNGVHFYKIGNTYYEIKPKSHRDPFDLFDIDKYSGEMRKDMSFILNLPASWPIKEIKSPQLNFFKEASREKIKQFEWPQYSNIFNSYNEYSKAYDLGDYAFKLRINEILEEKRNTAYNLNKHLFLSRDEFKSFYEQGEDIFSNIVKERNTAYEEYSKNIGWFVDFKDYLKTSRKGNIEEEINTRKVEYQNNKTYFTGLTEFIKYYVKGEDSLSVEIDNRIASFDKCKSPDGNGHLFNDMAEFLNYYLLGTVDKEYAKRRFKFRLNEFASLNLKGAKDSKKEEVSRYFAYLAECRAISNDAYPQMIEELVATNKKMSKEWNENGSYFDNSVEFYEVYITDDYKRILKSKKK